MFTISILYCYSLVKPHNLYKLGVLRSIMLPVPDLEEILKKFEQHREIFKNPLALCYENADVTAKYNISMLKLAESEERATEILHSFCSRFDADELQLQQLLNNPHHSVDYRLYTALSIHIQQQLHLNDEAFFSKVTEDVFTNYQDKQIQMAKVIPLRLVLKSMGSQFKNWTKATHVEAKRPNRWHGELKQIGDIIITRETLPPFKDKLGLILGEELIEHALNRDCDFTLNAFQNTFQVLYGQKDLQVERTKREGTDGISEYVVHPESPYQSLLYRGITALGIGLRFTLLPWWDNVIKRKENKFLRQDGFEREQIIRKMTEEVKQSYAELDKRNRTIVGLLSEISQLKYSGESHGIRNALHKVIEKNKDLIFGNVAANLNLTYNLVNNTITTTANNNDNVDNKNNDNDDNNNAVNEKRYLLDICNCFGIDESTLKDISKLELSLREISFDEPEEIGEETAVEIKGLLEKLDFGEQILFQEGFNKAAFLAKEYKAKHSESMLSQFNPFGLFSILIDTKKAIDSINDRLSRSGTSALLDEFNLADVIQEGYALAKKRSAFSLDLHLEYNPQLNSNKDAFVMMFHDLFNNSTDAGADCITLMVKRPQQHKEELPYFHLVESKGNYPALYVLVEDNGRGISGDTAVQINNYLKRDSEISRENLSTKGKGEKRGLGSENLKRLLKIHVGECIYESRENTPGTKIHLYLNRLGAA